MYLNDPEAPLVGITSFIHSLGYFERSIAVGVLLTLMLVLGAEGDMKPKAWNWYIAALWFTMNIIYVIAGVMHNIGEGYLAAQIFLALLIPGFYIVWMNNGRLAELYDAISISVIIFTILYAGINIIWFPYGEIAIKGVAEDGSLIDTVATTVFNGGRYMGIMPHPSRVAHFATLSGVTSLYILYRKKGGLFITAAISYGIAVTMAFMCASRASVLSIVVATAAFLLIYLKRGEGFKRFVAMILIVVLSFICCYNLINKGQDTMKLFARIDVTEEAYAADEQAVEEGEQESVLSGRFNKEGTLNTITSGRIGIWSVFADNLNLVGHDARYSYPLKIQDPDTGQLYYFSYPHNYALDAAYRAGVPVGVMIIILEIIAVLFALVKLFGDRSKFDDAYAFSIFGILFFFLTGNIDSIDHVFTRIAILFFYLAFIPVFGFGVRKEERDA